MVREGLAQGVSLPSTRQRQHTIKVANEGDFLAVRMSGYGNFGAHLSAVAPQRAEPARRGQTRYT